MGSFFVARLILIGRIPPSCYSGNIKPGLAHV